MVSEGIVGEDDLDKGSKLKTTSRAKAVAAFREMADRLKVDYSDMDPLEIAELV